MMSMPYYPYSEQNTAEIKPTLPEDAPLRERIIDVLRQVYDPEIPLNLYDLGLIYELNIDEANNNVEVVMTLTTPHCPVAGSMPGQVQRAVQTVSGIGEVNVRLTWDPPWSPENMTDEARLALGIL